MLAIDPTSKYALCNKGDALNFCKQYMEAIVLFDKVIAIDDQMAYAYNGRGLSKIKSGKLDDGINDINRSIELDDKDAYAYQNMGIYFFEMKNYSASLELFHKAKEMGASAQIVDQLIAETKSMQVSAENIK